MKIYKLAHEQARSLAIEYITQSPLDGSIIKIAPDDRTLEQNALMWPLLECFSVQLEWPVNGEKVKLDGEEWKDILTAAFKNEKVRLAQGLDGGMVMLGQRTKKFGKKKFSEFIDFIYAMGSLRGVIFEGDNA